MSRRVIPASDSLRRSFVRHVLHRTTAMLAVAAALGLGATTFVRDAGADGPKVTEVSRRDIVEKLAGKDAGVAVIEVTFEPGQEDASHRHAGPVFGYVLEGEYAHALDDDPIKTYKAGETFYEPTGSLHRVARNASTTQRTRLIAVILHPRDAKDVTVWEKGKE